MNSNLFKAILAMDSYNRGYGEGIILPVVLNTTKIGNATIISQSDTDPTHDPVKTGFYAIGYQMGSEKIISYRGTDSILGSILSGGDLWNGWGIGAGSTTSKQGEMAFKFYQQVAGSVPLYDANISLTGHSLGGGLAGLVGAVYKRPATVFDNMPFELSVSSTEARSDINNSAYSSSFKTMIYGQATPWAATDFPSVNITGAAINGEILSGLRGGQQTILNTYDLGDNVDLPDSIVIPGDEAKALHSMATLAIRMFADVGGVNGAALATDWRSAAVCRQNLLDRWVLTTYSSKLYFANTIRNIGW